MRALLAVVLLVACGASPAPGPRPATLDELGWLEGAWRSDRGDELRWMRDADGTLRGISDAEPSDCERVAAGTDPEHSSCSCPPERSALEIARRDGTLVHRMRSERASRTELPLAQIEPGRVAFASPDDHRIAYRLEGDVLTVSVDAAPARAFRRVPR